MPDLDGLDADTRLLALAKAASTMADPVLLRILGLLREDGELTVGALTTALPVSQPQVSIYLRCLSDCGYTRVRREGRRAHYRLAGPDVSDLLDRLNAHATGSLQGLLACLHCNPATDSTGKRGACC
ncbi:MAG: ArsR/SmtB family transcription factor [Sciscionella sp.]